MSIEIQATYEDGLLRPEHPLPLAEHQRVKLTIETGMTVARSSYGLIGWRGDPAVVRKIACEPEHGALESP
jgi:predicted DNA-binding antitoxin AbrB/MazE fold protein